MVALDMIIANRRDVHGIGFGRSGLVGVLLSINSRNMSEGRKGELWDDKGIVQEVCRKI